MSAAVGPVKAKFPGKLVLSDLDPISFDGSGGAAGFAKGGAKVQLASEGSATRMTYSAKANVGGKLAQTTAFVPGQNSTGTTGQYSNGANSSTR